MAGDAVHYEVNLLTEHDIFLFKEGTHGRLYQKLGSHLLTVDGVQGTHFAVWAPIGKPVSHLSGTRLSTGRVCQGDGLHPCRAAACYGASLLRLVGLSDHRLLCADGTLWHTSGSDVSRRSSPPARHRCHPRLGAFAFSQR